jgi:hypothetical protein
MSNNSPTHNTTASTSIWLEDVIATYSPELNGGASIPAKGIPISFSTSEYISGNQPIPIGAPGQETEIAQSTPPFYTYYSTIITNIEGQQLSNGTIVPYNKTTLGSTTGNNTNSATGASNIIPPTAPYLLPGTLPGQITGNGSSTVIPPLIKGNTSQPLAGPGVPQPEPGLGYIQSFNGAGYAYYPPGDASPSPGAYSSYSESGGTYWVGATPIAGAVLLSPDVIEINGDYYRDGVWLGGVDHKSILQQPGVTEANGAYYYYGKLLPGPTPTPPATPKPSSPLTPTTPPSTPSSPHITTNPAGSPHTTNPPVSQTPPPTSGPQGTPMSSNASSPQVANVVTITTHADTPFAPFSGATLTDGNAGATDTATITLQGIAGGATSDQFGTLSGTGVSKTGAGSYKITGTPAQVQTDLQQAMLTPPANLAAAENFVALLSDASSAAATPATAQILLAVHPGTAPPPSGTQPSFTGGAPFQDISGPTKSFGSLTLNDQNAGAADMVTVTLQAPGGGTPSDQFGTLTGNGLTQTAPGTYVATGTAAQVTAALDGATFTPAANLANGTEFAANLTDVSTGFTPPNPHITPTTSSVGFLYLSPSNSAAKPTVGALPSSETQSDAPFKPFAGVTLTDPTAGATDTMTVVLGGSGGNSDQFGTLSGSGITKTATGTYRITGTAAQVQAALQQATLTPPANLTAAETFNASLLDQSSGWVQPQGAPPAGASTQITVTPNGVKPPVLSNLPAAESTPDKSYQPFGTVTLSDPNANATDSVTVTLTDPNGNPLPAAGTLSGPGVQAAPNGVYTIATKVTPAQAQAALQGVTFTPAPGLTNTETVDLRVFVTSSAQPSGSPPSSSPTGMTQVTITAAGNSGTPPSTPPVNPLAGLPAGTNFAVLDTSTGQGMTTAGVPYSGPVAGLQNQLILVTPDNLNITATTPNVFIHSGSGNDALNVSQVNGNNVLDGSTGSNFLVGGSGDDQFYVDDRGPTSDIWSTVVGFHAGDSVTVWGVTPKDVMTWLNDQGAANAKGLTLGINDPGTPNVDLTIAGYRTADLSNGKLTISFGTSPNTPGLPGSLYMLIQGH